MCAAPTPHARRGVRSLRTGGSEARDDVLPGLVVPRSAYRLDPIHTGDGPARLDLGPVPDQVGDDRVDGAEGGVPAAGHAHRILPPDVHAEEPEELR